MTMTCNLGTEKMPIILDQPEPESNPSNQGVFHAIDLPSEEHNINAHNYINNMSISKNFRSSPMSEPLKSNLVKSCLGSKKITEEGMKKYPQGIMPQQFVYNASELLDFSGEVNEKDIPVSLKMEHKKYKKKSKEKEEGGLDYSAISQSDNFEVFDGKTGKESCVESKKKMKNKDKFNMVKKYYKLIAPHPGSCEPQSVPGKTMEKIYQLGSGTGSGSEGIVEQIKESDESGKLSDYQSFNYNEKRQNDIYPDSNMINDFGGFSKGSGSNNNNNNNNNNHNNNNNDNNSKVKNNYDSKLKCYKCYNCSFMSLNMNSLNYHSQKKDKCFNNNPTFHCPGCKNVFYSLIPLRVHLVHDHKMLQREVKIIIQNVDELSYDKVEDERDKSCCAYDVGHNQNEIIENGNLFGENMSGSDMTIENIGNREQVTKGNFVELSPGRGIAGERALEPCLNAKRQTMLESYLDDISNKGDCTLPPTLTQNGSDLLENTFNFTAPVSEQLPSIQPPPAHSSSNGLMDHPHLIINQQGSHGFVGMANVFPEHRVDESFKPSESSHFEGDGGLILANGNYLPHQIHDIPVINLDENHLGKQTENILSQDINMDDFPSYHENGLPALDDEENGCRLTPEDDDQEEKKKLKKLGVGYRCDINGCKVRLQSEKNIQYHRRCHEGTLYNCPECCKDCSTWVSLSSHLWQAHKIDMELYKCDQCPYKTPSYSRLTNIHRGIHGKARPFLCDVCGKGFKTVKQMRNHKNIHKAKMVRMSVCHCEICGRTVADKRQLELHINNTHKKKKPYLCYMCGYASAVKHSLVVHMRRHTGEKPYECEKCDYKTADHNALRRHKMKHTGVRNYKCNHCSYTCIQASTYKVHIKTKHPGLETDVIFGCGQCGFQTLNRGSFLSHTSEHENYNAQVRKQTRCRSNKDQADPSQEYYGENNRMDLIGPIISERVVETIRDLSGSQTLLEDDYYERITGDLESAHEMKFKTSGIT